MQRLTRYYQVMSTASVEVRMTETADSYALSAVFPDESKSPPKEGIDCGMTALLALCDAVAEKEIRPLRVELTCPATVHPDAYRDALRAPIQFDAEVGTFHFERYTNSTADYETYQIRSMPAQPTGSANPAKKPTN